MKTHQTTAQLKEIQFLNANVPSELISEDKEYLIEEYTGYAYDLQKWLLVDALNESLLFNDNDDDKFSLVDDDILIDGSYNFIINMDMPTYIYDWLCVEDLAVIQRELDHIQQY